MATKLSTKEAVGEINTLIDKFNLLQSEIKGTGTISASNFRKVETGLKGLSSVADKTNTAFKNLSKSQKNYVTQTRNLKAKVDQLTASNKKLQNSLKKTQTGFKGLFSSVKNLIGAFGIVAGLQIFGNIIKDAYELTKTFDSLNFTMEKVTGSSKDMANASVFLKGITRDFGVELVATTNRYLKFLAAARNSGISLKDTEQIFKSMTKAASVLGLKTDELSGVYLALEQMMSKGKITTEELRRQLGERLPGAMGIMASAIGVSVAKLDEMMKKGQVFSSEVLPKFAKAVESAYGIESVKKVDTLVSAQNRLSNSWQEFIQTFTEGDTILKSFIGGTLTNLSNAMNWFTDTIATEEQRLITERVKQRKIVEAGHEANLKSLLGHDKNYSEALLDLDKKVVAQRLKISEERNQEERKLLNRGLEEMMKEKADLIKKYDEKSVGISLKVVDTYEKEMIAVTKVFDKYKNHQDNAHKSTKAYTDELRKLIVDGGFDGFDDFMENLSEKTARVTEQFEFHKKNIQQSNIILPEEEDNGTNKALKQFISYTAPETIRWYREIIAHNNELIETSTDTGDIMRWQEENIEYLKEIDRLLNVIDLEDALEFVSPVDDIHILKQGIKDFAETLGVDGEEALDMYLKKYGETFDGIKDIHKKIEDAHKLRAEHEVAIEEEKNKMIEELQHQLLDFFTEIANSIFEVKIQKIEEEIEYETNKYDQLIDAAHLNKDEQVRLEEEKAVQLERLAKKKAELEKKEFLTEQGFKLAQIALETALAVFKIQALAATQFGIPLVGPALSAATLSQIPFVITGGVIAGATVLAQTIPAFKDGVENLGSDTTAMINDGGVQEYVERDGQILTSSTKNAIVGLKKGDTVHKDYDSLLNSKTNLIDIVKATTLANLQSNVQNRDITVVLDEQLGNIKKDLKNGIREGFNRVQLHSHTSVDLDWVMFKNNTL